MKSKGVTASNGNDRYTSISSDGKSRYTAWIVSRQDFCGLGLGLESYCLGLGLCLDGHCMSRSST